MKLEKLFWVGLLLTMIGTGLGIVVPLYIKEIIDLKNITKSILSHSFLIKFALILTGQTLLNAGGNFLISREGEKQIRNIRNLLQTHLIRLPISFFDNQDSGQLSSRVINDSVLVKNFITGVIPEFITSLITTIGTFAVLFFLDWKMAILIFLIFPLDALFTIPVGNFEERITTKTQKSLSDLTGIVTESLRNIRAVKLNEAEKSSLSKFGNNLKKLYRLSVKNEAVYAVLSPLQDLVSFVLIVSVLLYGGYRVQQSTLTIGTLTSFLIYFYQVVGPINSIADFYTNYKQTKGAVAKIIEILKEKPENYIANSNSSLPLSPYKLDIKKLYFSYGNKKVLENINMNFPPQQKIAIVGSSGAGKTTLINLITRLYEPVSGGIILNEKDSDEISLEQWRSLFGVVSQENYIGSLSNPVDRA
ncbi:ABC transporter ATP-binding protein (plasmid) [Lactobacillus helsingborgensis]|nr:ABC transporter ATP-binding protein [Lactobacillus helsingborgensis]